MESAAAETSPSAWLPSVCPLDCPDTCSLSVEVREGEIVQVRGSRANPYTRGAICQKVAESYPQFVHGERRLATPLLRAGGRDAPLRAASWEEALDAIYTRCAAEIDRWGAECVLPLNYAGPHGMLAGGSMDLRFFHRLGASQLHRTALCGGIRAEAYQSVFGAVPGIPPEQIAEARLVVIWGANITATHLHMTRQIHAARRGGAKVVVVDPRRTKIAQQADLHLAVRPGEDLALAWALALVLERNGGLDQDFIARHVQGAEAFLAAARELGEQQALELSGVPREALECFATWWQEGSPTALVVGNGLERNRNGGAGVRAVYALPALTGRFGSPGNGLVGGAGHAFPKALAALQRPDLLPAPTRTINILDVGAALLEETLAPPLQVVFIYNHNPLITHPDQNGLRRGLARPDLFLVGCDVVLTDSMALCDVVLPACSHFEHADLFCAYGQQWLQRAEAAIPPVGESLPNTEIFRRLAARFGFTEAPLQASDEALLAEALNWDDARLQLGAPAALSPSQAQPLRYGGEAPLLFHNLQPGTPSGRLELESDWLAQRYGEQARLPQRRALPTQDARFPLSLISPASARRTNSTFGGQAASGQAPRLHMHPTDANARGLAEGQPLRVFNTLGEVHLRLHITETIRPGTVLSTKGAWLHTSSTGQTISALAPGHKADLCGGACFNDARVQVQAA